MKSLQFKIYWMTMGLDQIDMYTVYINNYGIVNSQTFIYKIFDYL